MIAFGQLAAAKRGQIMPDAYSIESIISKMFELNLEIMNGSFKISLGAQPFIGFSMAKRSKFRAYDSILCFELAKLPQPGVPDEATRRAVGRPQFRQLVTPIPDSFFHTLNVYVHL